MCVQIVVGTTRVTFIDTSMTPGHLIRKWLIEHPTALIRYPWDYSDDVLEPNDTLFFNASEARKAYGSDLGTVVGITRNPYARAYDLWQRTKENYPEQYSDLSFIDFLSQLVGLRNGKVLSSFYRAQSEQIEGCDIVLDTNRLQEDFKQIQDLLKDDRPLVIPVDTLENDYYREHFDEVLKIKSIFEQVFPGDLTVLKYEF